MQSLLRVTPGPARTVLGRGYNRHLLGWYYSRHVELHTPLDVFERGEIRDEVYGPFPTAREAREAMAEGPPFWEV